MARASNEVKDLVNEVKNGFTTYEAKVKERLDQLYRRSAYSDSLIANLDPQITVRIPRASKIPALDARHVQGIVRASYQWHAAMDSGKDRAERRGDQIELYLAHLFTTKFDQGGKLFGPTRRDQTVIGTGLWWLEWNEFRLPKDEAKREDYRKRYDPFNLYHIRHNTAYWLPNDDGKPTIAVREFEIPYVEVAKRYGKGKDTDPLVILGKEFPGLRGAGGRDVNYSDLSLSKAKVCVVCDGQNIAHYIDIKGTGSEYVEAWGETPNPWGRPSLFVIPGQWNPDGADYSEMYQALLEEEYTEQRSVDVMVSHMASMAFTAKKLGQQIPPEILGQLISEDKPIPPITMENGMYSLSGTQAEFGQEPGRAAWELLALQIADRDATRPPPFLTNPDQNVIRDATLGAQLNAHETSNRMYDDARQHVISGIVEVCEAIKTFMCGGYGGMHNEAVHFTPSGNEPTSVYAGEYKDKELQLGRDAWELDYTLEVTIVASTQSQKALEYEIKKAAVADGAEEHEALIAVFTENVSGKKLKLNEEKWYQKYAPVVDNMTLIDLFSALEARDGKVLMPLAIQTGLVNPMLLGPQPQEGGIGGARTDPPSTAVPSAMAAV